MYVGASDIRAVVSVQTLLCDGWARARVMVMVTEMIRVTLRVTVRARALFVFKLL